MKLKYIVMEVLQENKPTSRLSRKYLSAPSSSVYSERLFSEAGNLYEKKQNRFYFSITTLKS